VQVFSGWMFFFLNQQYQSTEEINKALTQTSVLSSTMFN